MAAKRIVGVYLPSQQTIRRVCAEIREGWDDSEYGKRAPHWKRVECETVPAVKRSDFGAAVADQVEDEREAL